jgi:hypothetical protein
VLAASAVRAEPSGDDIKTARRLFTEAEELRARGDCAAAAERLRQAIAIKETPGLRFHLAYCEERTGSLLLARSDYVRAAELIAGGVSAPDVANLLGPAEKALSERLPTVQVRVPEYADSAKVQLDGRELSKSSLGTPLALDPGAHTVHAEAVGYERYVLEFIIAEGEDRVVDVALRRSGSSPAPAAAPGAPVEGEVHGAGSGLGAREFVVIGESALALAGVGVGIGFRFKRAAADDDAHRYLEKLDQEGRGCAGAEKSGDDCVALHDAVADRDRSANIATGAFIGAGVLAAAAVTTWFLWPKRSPTELGVAVAPAPGGAVLFGSF